MSENIVINKVPSNTASPKDIVIDLMPTPPFTEAVSVLYFWRFDDEPDSNFQFLGEQTVGNTFATPFEGSGRTIRISQIGKAANGVQSAYDPREGEQTTIFVPSLTESILTLDGSSLSLDGDILTLGS